MKAGNIETGTVFLSNESNEGSMNCKECDQPMLPGGMRKRPNYYDHASGCPLDHSAANIDEAVARACRETTLLDALTWIAVWENNRAVKQAGENDRWETCFRANFRRVMEKFQPPPYVHIADGGLTLCGTRIPDMPHGDRWTSVEGGWTDRPGSRVEKDVPEYDRCPHCNEKLEEAAVK